MEGGGDTATYASTAGRSGTADVKTDVVLDDRGTVRVTDGRNLGLSVIEVGASVVVVVGYRPLGPSFTLTRPGHPTSGPFSLF